MSPSQFRLIRVAGIGICCTLVLLRSLLMLKQHLFLHSMRHALWLAPMTLFITTLLLSTTSRPRSHAMTLLLLAAQSLGVLGIAFTMGGQHATNYEGYLLLVVALQVALTLPVRFAAFWILAQTSLLALSYVVSDHADPITASVSIIFKMFTYAVVVALKHEADARAEFAALNAQMMVTRELYAERSRSHERLRISRDLHDVLGHRLTALSLNLEIATHKATPDTGREEVAYAQGLTKDLLAEVRDVVSAMRPAAHFDLRTELERVARGFAPIRIHLTFPAEPFTCDAPRGEVLVRCAQELITNAVKHARARQVWIELEISPERVLHLRSHDDGQPSPVALRERPAGRREGTGLLAMRERFADYGGTIEASTTSADGFTIHGFLPMLSGAS